jgi:LruC domain-containing protein
MKAKFKLFGFSIAMIAMLFLTIKVNANPVVSCDVTKTNGGGFTTTIESVVDNCNGTHTIVLRVEHNGCGGPSCKELSHYSVEADAGTYSGVSIVRRSGQMTWGSIDMGPNLGSDPFDGFKIDNTKKIGGGIAGVFAITYTLTGGLQDQRASAKAGNNGQIVSFTVADFEYVMNCNGTTCNNDPSGLNGNVFHDINGMTDNTVNGDGIGSASGSQLYANLLTSAGVVLKTVAVANDGSYSFEVGAGTYKVQLSTVQGTLGSGPPQTILPSGWVNTGEFIGTGQGNDGNANGLINNVVVVANDITENVNFGIQQRPVPETNTAPSQENPGGSVSVAVPASIFVANDPDGNVVSIKITAFPSNASTITINGNLYSSANFPAGGVTVAANSNGNPTQSISVDPIDGVVTVSIPFKAIDNAGFESLTTGAANLPFTLPEVLGGLSGNVFHDINGLTDNIVNGTGIGSASSTNLYANLLNSSQLVIASIQVSSNGTYSFSELANATYTVQLSTVQGTLGQAAPATNLPSGWVNTGEFVGTTAGSDGTADGKIQAIVAGNLVTVNVNFGIEQRPTTGTATAAIQQNPGGEIFVTVPPATFIFDDPDGDVVEIRLISFPVNATSIKVGSNTYTSQNFPANGIIIPLNPNGELTLAIQVDPVDGAVTVPFPFKSKDNAGFESSTTGTANVPFSGEYIPVDNLYPAAGFGTLAFEDLWPGKGDYDFNDLVIDYQFELISNTGNYVDQIKGNFVIRAFGASYENGFGFQLSGALDPEDLYVEGSHITENYITLASNGVEAGQSKATIIVYDNAYNEMAHPGMGIGVNTEAEAPYVEPVELEIRIYLPENTYTFAQVDIASFNPFIIVNKERGVEVHLPNYPPTDLADMGKFGTWEDNSNPGTGRWYVNDKNLPWAINIYESFAYPLEKQEILWAHLKFAEWAMSGGALYPDWYKNLTGYRNNSLIYQTPAK